MRTVYAFLFLLGVLWALNFVTQHAVWAWVVIMTFMAGGQ